MEFGLGEVLVVVFLVALVVGSFFLKHGEGKGTEKR